MNTRTVEPRLWFSIAILGESIHEAMMEVCPKHGKEIPEGLVSLSMWRAPNLQVMGNFILDEMLEKGWCPFDIECINFTSTASVLYYLGNLQPPRSDIDHSQCTKQICKSMVIDASYQTRHCLTDCHGCLGFDSTDAIANILEGERIPLLEKAGTSPDGDQRPSFQVTEETPSRYFVTISHVWSEGLGNPHHNTLPTCSLEWVANIVDSLPGQRERTLPFWIDAICVPLQPEELRIRAMNRLRMPYQLATCVLVLDSYLFSQDSSALLPIELLARILCCSWSRRLWTFQEARR